MKYFIWARNCDMIQLSRNLGGKSYTLYFFPVKTINIMFP